MPEAQTAAEVSKKNDCLSLEKEGETGTIGIAQFLFNCCIRKSHKKKPKGYLTHFHVTTKVFFFF
jgi:hypothetical protein